MPANTMPTSRLMGVVIAVFLLGSLAACGGGGGGGAALPDAAGAPTADTSDDTSGDDGVSGLSREDALLKFAQCMREHGVDMPDPEPGGGIRLNGNGLSEDQVQAAQEDCQEFMDQAMPEDGGGRQMSEEDKQAMLDMAQCMRDKGYDFPDPQFEGGRVTQRVGPGQDTGMDPDDPQFQDDLEQCHTESGIDPGRLLSEQES